MTFKEHMTTSAAAAAPPPPDPHTQPAEPSDSSEATNNTAPTQESETAHATPEPTSTPPPTVYTGAPKNPYVADTNFTKTPSPFDTKPTREPEQRNAATVAFSEVFGFNPYDQLSYPNVDETVEPTEPDTAHRKENPPTPEPTVTETAHTHTPEQVSEQPPPTTLQSPPPSPNQPSYDPHTTPATPSTDLNSTPGTATPPTPNQTAVKPPQPTQPTASVTHATNTFTNPNASTSSMLTKLADFKKTHPIKFFTSTIVSLVVVTGISVWALMPSTPAKPTRVVHPPIMVPTTQTKPLDTELTVHSAQSHCPAGGSPDANVLFHRDPSNRIVPGVAWLCPISNGLTHKRIVVTFSDPVIITEVQLMPGYDYINPATKEDYWFKYRQANNVEVSFDDTHYYGKSFIPKRQKTVIQTIGSPPTNTIEIWITGSQTTDNKNSYLKFGHTGSGYTSDLNGTVAISWIKIIGHLAN